MQSRLAGSKRVPAPVPVAGIAQVTRAHQVILGVDPSLRGTGYGVIRLAKPFPQALAKGTIACPQSWEHSRCLVKIAQALNSFRERTSVTMVRLGPASVVKQIGAFMQHATFACTCEILRGVRQSVPHRVPVFPMRGGLFVQLRGIARDEKVQISISAVGRTWRSDYESLDTVDIQVKE